jgi:electron transfer flavoprotein alpha subunit
MTDYRGIAVYCELNGNKLSPISTEALGAGRKLADALGQELCAIIIGSAIGPVAARAVEYGASRVYVVDDALLKDYQAEIYVAVLKKVVEKINPVIFIMGQTDSGREIAPRLAFRLGTAAALDCVDLAIAPSTRRLLQTKPVYGGNARAVFVTGTDPQVVTIRTRSMPALAFDPQRHGEIINVPAGLPAPDNRVNVLERKVAEVAGVKLEDAKAVVAGGRGIGGAEGFKQLEQLACLLKGAVGASRPPCDSGWVPDTIQIGLTGRIIAPDLYIAVALSGSSQHMSGCSGSRTIVAINKDKEANIFRYARFGIVGDWKKVLPALTAKVKELLNT